MLWPFLTMRMTHYQLYRRLGMPKKEPVWYRGENFAATRFQYPHPPAHSKSPYQLCSLSPCTGLNGNGFHTLKTMTCLCHCTILATVISDGLGFIQHSIYHTENRHECIYHILICSIFCTLIRSQYIKNEQNALKCL